MCLSISSIINLSGDGHEKAPVCAESEQGMAVEESGVSLPLVE